MKRSQVKHGQVEFRVQPRRSGQERHPFLNAKSVNRRFVNTQMRFVNTHMVAVMGTCHFFLCIFFFHLFLFLLYFRLYCFFVFYSVFFFYIFNLCCYFVFCSAFIFSIMILYFYVVFFIFYFGFLLILVLLFSFFAYFLEVTEKPINGLARKLWYGIAWCGICCRLTSMSGFRFPGLWGIEALSGGRLFWLLPCRWL